MSPSATNPLSPKYISRISKFHEWCTGKKVLHLGCSSGKFVQDRIARGSFLHGLLQEISSELSGVDLHGESLTVMRDMGFERLYEGNAEKLEDIQINDTFDVVIAGDLLEHITRPGAMLDGVKTLLKPDGRFIISTNNAFGLHYQIKRWMGRYSEHFEHVCFFSPETLVHLFERHDYRVLEMYGAYTEPPFTLKQKIVFTLGKPLLQIAPVLAGTLVVVATPNH